MECGQEEAAEKRELLSHTIAPFKNYNYIILVGLKRCSPSSSQHPRWKTLSPPNFGREQDVKQCTGCMWIQCV
jgi:hypothetical protein